MRRSKLRHAVWQLVGQVERARAEDILALRPVLRTAAIRLLVKRRGIEEAARRLGMSAEQLHEHEGAPRAHPTQRDDPIMDDSFEFPETVDDLATVPEGWRSLYEPCDAQGFALIPQAAEALGAVKIAADAKLAEALAAQDARILAQAARIAADKKLLVDSVAGNAIRQRLHERGVRPGLMTAAITTFRRQFQVALEKRGDGEFESIIEDSYGRVSAADALDAWLDKSEEAAAFRPPPPVKDGPLTQALRAMRGSVH